MIWILAGIIVNIVVGAAVLAASDDDEHSLFHWYESCPTPVAWIAQPMVLMAWPVVLWAWRSGQR
jgi:ABC-type cobalamin transport system permease subunit